jgi:hypothetical protein
MGKAAAIMNEGICLQGMWLSEEVLLSVNVGRRCSVNSNGNPFCNVRGLLMSRVATTDNFLLSFYYVKAGGDDRFLFSSGSRN